MQPDWQPHPDHPLCAGPPSLVSALHHRPLSCTYQVPLGIRVLAARGGRDRTTTLCGTLRLSYVFYHEHRLHVSA